MQIKAISLGEKSKTYIFSRGAVLNDLLEKWRHPKKDEAVFINKVRILDFNTPLKNGDIVIMVFPMRAAGPPVEMKKFKVYIEMRGFEPYREGKGDHEIWINKKGKKLTINPNRHDKRCVDWASVDALKKILGYSALGKLIYEINNF